MGEQTIQSRDISVSEVFQYFYAVPDYQREYVWQTENVEQLLSDINSELAATNGGAPPEYFIGSIVVCPGSQGVWDLIDGQQRMTTLYVCRCAIRDRLEQLGAAVPASLGPQIAATSIDVSGNETFRFRLDLQYEDSGDVLVKIARGNFGPGATRSTQSIKNIANAYTVALSFLAQQFGENVATLRGFYGYLANKVKLIRIETENVAKALKIFETINDRGVSLNSMDLLKNLLFMKAKPEEFRKLKDIWKELQDTLFHMGEKPLRFLRYYILAMFDIEVLREDEIYSWFVKNEKTSGSSEAPLKFAKELLTAARAYSNFLDGNDQSGKANPYLQNMGVLGGRSARQHLILLLAGRHLPAEMFEKLCREVENLFFCYVITRENTRDFERHFARWATELRALKTAEALDVFFDNHFRKTKADLSARFEDAFTRLHADFIQLYRLRYVLGKLTQFVDLQGFGETDGTKSLTRYVDGGIDIEHIFPQTPTAEATAEFGPGDYPVLTGMLGNLVLAEPAINRSLGNLPYSKKRPVYAESQFLLTRALAKEIQVGSNTSIDRAVSEIKVYQTWNKENVESRQKDLAALARKVWDMPAASTEK